MKQAHNAALVARPQRAPRRRSTMSRAVLAGVILGLIVWSGPWTAAEALETKAREALLMDFETGAVLLEKSADDSMPPASMSKIMTAYMVFDQLKAGRLSLDDKLPVSEKAWRMGGSKMFVEVGDEIRVEDLLRGVIVQSGNDACIVLAEGLAGSEDAFAEAMTDRAREIGLQGSTFANATGWPHPDHRMTARDLAQLASLIIRDFSDYYSYYSETEFTWSDISQGNRNPLLYKNIGADGLKTGHTEEAGYGLTASAQQKDRRLILVVNGLESTKARAEEAARLMSWGFREFDNYRLFEAGETVEQASVWLGEVPTVPLVTAQDLVITLDRKARKDMTVTLLYDKPIPSPITKGTEVARLRVDAPGFAPIEIPLEAGADVNHLCALGRIFASIMYMVLGSP